MMTLFKRVCLALFITFLSGSSLCYSEERNPILSYLDRYEESAKAGDPDAQYRLGLLFYFGKVKNNEPPYEYDDGDLCDTNEAMKYFLLASEKGNIWAQFAIGRMYHVGYGVKEDYVEAIKWYKKVIDNNLNENTKVDGKHDTIDTNNSISGIKKLQSRAAYRIGYMYYKGHYRLLKKDYNEAIKWFEIAANNEWAKFILAEIYNEGYGVEKDFTKSVKFLHELAEPFGDRNSSGLEREAKLSQVPQNLNEAKFLYQSKINAGDVNAMVYTAATYYEGIGTEQNFEEAFKLYNLAAQKGDKQAHIMLGNMYRKGEGVEQNYIEAAEQYREAADGGDFYGKLNLASMYYEGLGVPQNYQRAIHWYMSALREKYQSRQNFSVF